MPNAGDSFTTTLLKAHLEWGELRYTDSRGIIYGEGYLQIPADVAYSLNITNGKSAIRSAEYDFSTADGYIKNGKLLASGNQSKEEFAKQFHGAGDLKLLGDWYYHLGLQLGDKVQCDFISDTEILLTKI